MKKLILILFILILFSNRGLADSPFGVQFSTKMPKTQITLFYNHKAIAPDNLELRFNMSVSNPLSIGQVLMIRYGEYLLSLTYIGKNEGNCKFVLNPVTDKNKYIEIPFDVNVAKSAKWFPLSISLSKKTRTAQVQLFGSRYTLAGLAFPPTTDYNISFGPHDAGLSDVISMAISSVEVKENGIVKYAYPFNESMGDYATDTVSKTLADVKYPVWLINSHYYWNHSGSYKIAKTAGITYDTKRNALVMVDRDSLKMISMKTNNFSGIPLERKLVGFSGEAVYDPAKDDYLFYNLYDGDGVTTPFMMRINTEAKILSYSIFEFHNPLHHHATFWDERTNKLYVFGGYGNYSYSGNLMRFNDQKNKWDTLKLSGDRIAPRMHTVAGVAADSDMFYIYGGVGNETGKQELGREFYSDLYLVDTKNLKVKKLWAHPTEDTDLIPKRSLIYMKELNSIYLLCSNRNNGKIGLYAYDISSGKCLRVSNETLVNTNCINSTAYLFYDKELQKFCMAVKQAEDSKDIAQVEVYTLNFPPISFNELGKETKADSFFTRKTLIYTVVLTVLILAGLSFFLIKKRGKNESENDGTEESLVLNILKENTLEIKNNSVYIFGEFTVINRDGVNISARFSSKIKQLFTLVLLHSIRYGEGISTEKLSLTIWNNKDVTEAKNIRGVTINHLRTLLKELDGITLEFVDEKWMIRIEDNCYCDYCEVLKLSKQGVSLPIVQSLLVILKRGSLLPAFYQFEWFENSKIEFDEFLISQLENGIRFLSESKLWSDTIMASNILFTFDHLNEVALQYKLTATLKSGNTEKVQKIYDRFCREYQICYNEKYKKKLSDLTLVS